MQKPVFNFLKMSLKANNMFCYSTLNICYEWNRYCRFNDFHRSITWYITIYCTVNRLEK